MSHMGPARLSPPKTPRQSRNSEDTSMTVSNTNLRPAEPTKTKPPRPISFAPSFAPALSKKNVDQVVDSEDVQFVNTIPNSASKFTSPPSHKRRGRYSKRGGKGRLATRLANLCNVRANDAVKLQNPAFSRHCSAFDLNHPRHRAKSHTDLMILGDYPYPWVNTADRDSNMTVLGHIYQHVRSDKKPRHEGELAWVTFTMATARSVKLQKGSQLRLYNSAIIPSRKSVVITDNATEDLNSNGCKLIILCTDLCEPYELNPLPRVGCTENNASTAKE